MFFDKQGPFFDTAREVLRSIRAAAIEHVFVGDVALVAYGVERECARIELCVSPADFERFRGEMAGYVLAQMPGQVTRFTHPITQIEADLLPAGEIVGDRFRQQEICWPSPREAEWIAGIPVPALPRLIELKLATWDVDDQRDVMTLIQTRSLDAAFGEQLHALVRPAYEECCAWASGRATR